MVNKFIIKILMRFAKRNEMESKLLRAHFRKRHRINVGLYSYGCFDASRIGPNTTIGRYCSIAPTAYILRRNHGVSFMSLHPYFYNEVLHFPIRKEVFFTSCVIDDDVWVGHAATITPAVTHIGRGAIIGAGSVVTRNVPPYAIVVGNPAKVIRFRFDDATIEAIEKTRWWELEKDDLIAFCKAHSDAVFNPTQFLVVSQ